MTIDGKNEGGSWAVSVRRAVSSVWELSKWIRDCFQAGELHESCVLKIAAEDGVADIDDNGLGRLGVDNTRHMNI